MSELRYLVDENTMHAIGDQWRRREPKIVVLDVGDDLAPSHGTPDPEILFWIEREGYCLVTRNRRSMPQHLQEHLAAGHRVPGIFTMFTLRPRAPGDLEKINLPFRSGRPRTLRVAPTLLL